MKTKEVTEVNDQTGLPIFKKGELSVEVHYDEWPCNPIEEWDYEKTAFMHLKSYRNGDLEYLKNSETIKQDEAFIAVEHEGASRFDALLDLYGCPYEAGEVYKTLKEFTFLEMHDHRIDRRGVLGVKTEAISAKNGYGCTPEEFLEGIQDTYGSWCAGEVYGFVVKSPDDDHIDSCWGFYDEKDCLQEGISSLNYLIEPVEKIIQNIYLQIENLDPYKLADSILELGNQSNSIYLKSFMPKVLLDVAKNTVDSELIMKLRAIFGEEDEVFKLISKLIATNNEDEKIMAAFKCASNDIAWDIIFSFI